jgi:hypothetical protein
MKYFLISGFVHGLSLPLVLEGVSRLPVYENAFDANVLFDIEYDA